ncbi:MAG: hypothetical protein ABI666_02020 [Ferruginibacter sp.]
MKKNVWFIICFLFFAMVVKAQDPKPRDLVEKYWIGLSEQDANFTKSGKIQLKQTMKLTLNSDNTVYGTSTTKMTLDGVCYSNSNEISGTFYPSTWSVYIKDGSTTSADPLPNGLKWCKGFGTLTFYRNQTHPGYYLFRGEVTDDCGGKTVVEFSDYPY